MERMRKILPAAGLAVLLVMAFCAVPAVADPVPEEYFRTSIHADKAVYSPGDPITYRFWVDEYSDPHWFDIFNAIFTIDPNIDNIAVNTPDTCMVTGNSVVCDVDYLDEPNYGFWVMAPEFHGWLWVVHKDSTDFGTNFLITGKIREGTPAGTAITSSASFTGYYEDENGGPPIADCETTVHVAMPGPEFPSVFLPAAMVIGIFCAVILARMMRDQ